MAYAEKKSNITGSTSDPSLVMDLMENLKVSAIFSNVTFHYTEKGTDSDAGVYDFELIAEVK